MKIRNNEEIEIIKGNDVTIPCINKEKYPKLRHEINFELLMKQAWSMPMILSIKIETFLASLNTDKSWFTDEMFDADGTCFAMDKYANVSAYNVKEIFNNLRDIDLLQEIATAGKGSIPEGIGDAALPWKDDNGTNHKHTIEDFYCMPKYPFNMLSVPKLAQKT